MPIVGHSKCTKYKDRKNIRNVRIKINNVVKEFKKDVKYLGIQFNQAFNFNENVKVP